MKHPLRRTLVLSEIQFGMRRPKRIVLAKAGTLTAVLTQGLSLGLKNTNQPALAKVYFEIKFFT